MRNLMTKQQYSPTTQGVSDAAEQVYWDWGNLCPASADTIAAAALRAAAYAILPLDSPHIEDFPEDDDDSPSDRIGHLKKRIRNEFLSIAKELENYKRPEIK